MSEIKEIAQLGGTVITVILFLVYLQKKDEMTKKTYEEFNNTINNHLDHSNKVIDKNNQVITEITLALKQLCWQLRNGKKRKKIPVHRAI